MRDKIEVDYVRDSVYRYAEESKVRKLESDYEELKLIIEAGEICNMDCIKHEKHRIEELTISQEQSLTLLKILWLRLRDVFQEKENEEWMIKSKEVIEGER